MRSAPVPAVKDPEYDNAVSVTARGRVVGTPPLTTVTCVLELTVATTMLRAFPHLSVSAFRLAVHVRVQRSNVLLVLLLV